MPIIYKLINPLNKKPYYVGYTEEILKKRYIGHLTQSAHPTTIYLLSIDILPLIETIVSGPDVTKETEIFWIKELAKTFELENRDGLVKYQMKKTFFDVPKEVMDQVDISEADRYKIAIDLLVKEMPRDTSIPIMIRITNILKWATNKKSLHF